MNSLRGRLLLYTCLGCYRWGICEATFWMSINIMEDFKNPNVLKASNSESLSDKGDVNVGVKSAENLMEQVASWGSSWTSLVELQWCLSVYPDYLIDSSLSIGSFFWRSCSFNFSVDNWSKWSAGRKENRVNWLLAFSCSIPNVWHHSLGNCLGNNVSYLSISFAFFTRALICFLYRFRGLTNLEPFFAMETKPPSWH